MKTSATALALLEALQLTAHNRPSDRYTVLVCQAAQRYIQDLESRLAALEGLERNDEDVGLRSAEGSQDRVRLARTP